jgi:hypothetical protein
MLSRRIDHIRIEESLCNRIVGQAREIPLPQLSQDLLARNVQSITPAN